MNTASLPNVDGNHATTPSKFGLAVKARARHPCELDLKMSKLTEGLNQLGPVQDPRTVPWAERRCQGSGYDGSESWEWIRRVCSDGGGEGKGRGQEREERGKGCREKGPRSGPKEGWVRVD